VFFIGGFRISSRQLQCAEDRIHDVRIQRRLRTSIANFIVKSLPHHCSVTKDAPGQRHRDRLFRIQRLTRDCTGGLASRKKAMDHAGRQFCQFPARMFEYSLGRPVALLGRGQYSGENSREIGWRRSVRDSDELFEGANVPDSCDDGP
jgi:hypothetical protein